MAPADRPGHHQSPEQRQAPFMGKGGKRRHG
jgi:hypothetical protein